MQQNPSARGQAETGDLRLIRRRKKQNIIREIYRYGDLIVKRFVKLAPRPDTRQVWQMEHDALCRLSDLSMPKTYGFIQNRFKGATEIIYSREYVRGEPVSQFTREDMAPLAAMMAKVHVRGVITRDPTCENFIRDGAGNIIFIDFGRSKLVHPRSPLLEYFIGKEMARTRLHALDNDGDLYERFEKAYFACFPMAGFRRRMVNYHYGRWNRYWDRKSRRKQAG